jgi:hypothetical protein
MIFTKKPFGKTSGGFEIFLGEDPCSTQRLYEQWYKRMKYRDLYDALSVFEVFSETRAGANLTLEQLESFRWLSEVTLAHLIQRGHCDSSAAKLERITIGLKCLHIEFKP